MPPPPPPAQDTRTRILDAAQRLFHEQGYHATGISTILREADVNAGSLYNLFPSKEALLEAVLERYTHLLRPVVIDPVEAATPDPIERIFALLAQYRAWLTPINFAMGCPIGNLALETADNLPRVRALCARNFDGWAAAVQSWLDTAALEGRLPPTTDRPQLARFILTIMEGGVMQARAEGSPAPYDACVAQLRRYFDALETEARGHRAPTRASKPARKRPTQSRAPKRPTRSKRR